MNILHLITSLKVGGAEHALCALLKQLPSSEGWNHHVAYFYDGPCRAIIQQYGIPTYHLGGAHYKYYPWWTYRTLRKLIKQLKPDMIHSSLWSANIFGRALGQDCKIPVISALHGNCIHEGTFRNFLDRHTAHLSHRIVAVAPSVKESYVRTIVDSIPHHHHRIKVQEALTVIPNGIDARELRTKAFDNPYLRSDFGIPTNAFIIGAVGRLEPIKCYDLLIESFAQLHAMHKHSRPLFLFLIGDGSQRAALTKQVTSLGLIDAVIIPGAQSDVHRYYPLFDCFAVSSRSEGISLAMLEALCCGVPVVTTTTGVHHDVITNGVHGLVIPPGQARSLWRALETLYSNQHLLANMRIAAEQLVDEKFTIDRVAKQYRAIFLETYQKYL